MDYRTPDPDQQLAIDIADGYHLVLAPPGCGKTFILAERVIQANACGIDFSDMVCLTFTNRAARGMRDRISQRTNNPVPPTLFVGNVHRFCSQYLFENNKIPQHSAIIDDIDCESIITQLAHLDPNEDHTQFAQEIVNLQHARSQQRQGMPIELIVHADKLNVPDTSLWQRRIEIADLYEKTKEEDNLLDFEDLLEKTYFFSLAEQETLKRYRWLQIDEVQDLNTLQIAILDLFTQHDNHTTIYLGDEQQAIFSFVGAKLDTLEHLKQRCGTNIHHLGRNHRSPKYLLDLYNRYAVNQLGIDPDLLPQTDDKSLPLPQDLCLFQACFRNLDRLTRRHEMTCLYDQSPCTQCGKSVANEYLMTIKLAQRYAALGEQERVAIIVPTNRDADLLSAAFGEIPHFKISGRDLFSSPSVQALLSHLTVVSNETCFIAWARLLYHLHVVPQYAMARNLMRSLRSWAISPTDLLIYNNSTYLQEFAADYQQQELVIFDTETTGLDIFNDDIIQIAAIKVRNGKMVEGSEFEVIIETDKELPPIVGGHENPMLEVYLNSERVSRSEGLTQFLDYCNGHVLVGHNVEFDYHILHFNMLRALGYGLEDRPRYDTLKLTRLVKPRLRVYKLERLLETLHLEGINSHNAIDDVKATLSLLNYCYQQSPALITCQRELFAMEEFQMTLMRFRQIYRDIFLHTYHRLYEQGKPNNPVALLVDELHQVYLRLLAQNLIEPVGKWHHILNYLNRDLIQTEYYPSLKEQLDKYMVDINTCRESDLCDSESMRSEGAERFFIATAHKAKGLEFDSVIVFNTTEGAYPYYYNIKNNDIEHIREDARRFYVAISRAKKRLCLTYANIGDNGYASKPSPFLASIYNMLNVYAFNPTTGKIETAES